MARSKHWPMPPGKPDCNFNKEEERLLWLTKITIKQAALRKGRLNAVPNSSSRGRGSSKVRDSSSAAIVVGAEAVLVAVAVRNPK